MQRPAHPEASSSAGEVDPPAHRVIWHDIRGGPNTSVMRAIRHEGAFAFHRHDFFELFWIESGRGLHAVNGRKDIPLSPGDVVFIRADDCHSARPKGKTPLRYVNVSFPFEAAESVAARFPKEWPWRSGPIPLHVHLSPEKMARLHKWTAELSLPFRRQIDLETFLMDVTRMVSESPENELCAGCPRWLHDAVEQFTDPRHLRLGTKRLAEIAGRSPEHINRVFRLAQGRTATDVINIVRMRWAAGMLRMSDRAIPAIAADCGIANLSHFYKLFKIHFHVTPRHYRVEAGESVGY